MSDRCIPLITGASGMVGSYVMARWLQRGNQCVVVSRPKGRVGAIARIDRVLEPFEQHWGVSLERPAVVEGDLSLPRLGLSDDALKLIRSQCKLFLHSAASLSFLPAVQHPSGEPFSTNVEGSSRCIALCQELGITNFHQVSTAYVCGLRSGIVCETENDLGQSFANDYERSKSIAETLLSEAMGQGSVTVYRPSIVVDRSGLSPVSGDRTIYGAFSLYQSLAKRFGLPERGEWFRNLGFVGGERKNLVDVAWVADAIVAILENDRFHGRSYHLTSESGTTVESLERAFRGATPIQKHADDSARTPSAAGLKLDELAKPYVETFLPYFRDDPQFDRRNIGQVIDSGILARPPAVDADYLVDMVRRWTPRTGNAKPSPASTNKSSISKNGPETNGSPASRSRPSDHATPSPGKSVRSTAETSGDDARVEDELVICGYAVRLPGGVNDISDFESLLMEGRSAIQPLPESRLDRSLYFDSRRCIPGKTYSDLGGCVDEAPLDDEVESAIESLGRFDLTHRQFARVASDAMLATFGRRNLDTVDGVDSMRAGVLVGHSGGTAEGGAVVMNTMAEAVAEVLAQAAESPQGSLEPSELRATKQHVVESVRQQRPQVAEPRMPDVSAFQAASLAARITGCRGRREVIDAACSSSLLALQHAASAMRSGRLDVAIVGGATYNHVDNLALFSQSGACSETGSYPFDQRASGLISSEGYVAIVLVKRSVAESLGLPIHASLDGVGIASDGKGKGLWAPRSEGQQLAIRRGASDSGTESLSEIDYLECHATSTQVGDATELESLDALLRDDTTDRELPIGSLKSNLGHLLEAAGVAGLIKCLIAMKRRMIPASIHFERPNNDFAWNEAKIRVVDRPEYWAARPDRPRRAGINAFGIGGLNAHAIIKERAAEKSPAMRRPDHRS
ncbi:MAG: SDR family oxidoreductase, partial [Planctomycetota bacterium]